MNRWITRVAYPLVMGLIPYIFLAVSDGSLLLSQWWYYIGPVLVAAMAFLVQARRERNQGNGQRSVSTD